MVQGCALAALAVLALVAQAFGAGTIGLGLSQEFDSEGRPLAGGLLYFYQAGTTTPQSAFMDTALSLPHPIHHARCCGSRCDRGILAQTDKAFAPTVKADVTF